MEIFKLQRIIENTNGMVFCSFVPWYGETHVVTGSTINKSDNEFTPISVIELWVYATHLHQHFVPHCLDRLLDVSLSYAKKNH